MIHHRSSRLYKRQNPNAQTVIIHRQETSEIKEDESFQYYEVISNKGFGPMIQFPLPQQLDFVEVEDYRTNYQLVFHPKIVEKSSYSDNFNNIHQFLLKHHDLLINILITSRQRMETVVKFMDEYNNLKDIHDWAKKILEITQVFSAHESKACDAPENNNHTDLSDCLSEISLYLKKRAAETSSAKTLLFNFYNGKDYYDRRMSFLSILTTLLDENNIQTSQKMIQNEIAKFTNVIARNEYAKHLSKLVSILENHVNVDADRFQILEYIELYKKMNAYTKAVANKNGNEFIASKLDYHHAREESDENIQKEFIEEKKLFAIECKNITYFKKPGADSVSRNRKNEEQRFLTNLRK